jgi:hypothetical protein
MVMVVVVFDFSSDDDHALLQAYVMTLLLLGCGRVNKFFRFLLQYNVANIQH